MFCYSAVKLVSHLTKEVDFLPEPVTFFTWFTDKRYFRCIKKDGGFDTTVCVFSLFYELTLQATINANATDSLLPSMVAILDATICFKK